MKLFIQIITIVITASFISSCSSYDSIKETSATAEEKAFMERVNNRLKENPFPTNSEEVIAFQENIRKKNQEKFDQSPEKQYCALVNKELGKYALLTDEGLMLQISKDEAIAKGISEKMYNDMTTKVNEINDTFDRTGMGVPNGFSLMVGNEKVRIESAKNRAQNKKAQELLGLDQTK